MIGLFAAFFVLCASLSRADEEEESVHTLTIENFDEFVKGHSHVLVEFYAPWCGHCKALAPEYEKAAQAIHADENVDAVLAKVDATQFRELATKYGVSGFPTLKYFTGDVSKPEDYTGGRTEATIVSWLRTRSMPPVSQLASLEEIEAFKASGKVTVVGFLAEDSDEAKVLLSVAEANRETVLVGQVSSAELRMPEVEFGNVYLFRTFEEPVVKFEGELNEQELTAFLNANRFPLIDEIGPENYKDYVDLGLPLVWIALQPDNVEEKDNIIALLTPHAKHLKGKVSFTWLDGVKFAQHVNNLGIASTPGMLVAGPAKFLFKGSMTSAEDLQKFFDDFEAGTLDPHLKSQDIPEPNDGDVFVLVGKAFADVVGKDKDVLVEYYAPWCGHCKRLAPEYEVVGQAFHDVKDVVIAKLDATENDTPESIQGFPTLLFYPKGKTVPEGIKYEGERKSASIISWVKDKATVDVSAVKSEL